jgi:hypothetical protein
MDHRVWYRDAGIAPHWVETLRTAARTLGWKDEPIIVRGWISGAELITCIRSLGGSVDPVGPFFGWSLAVRNDGYVEPSSRFAPELVDASVHLDDFHGVVALEVEGERFLALRTNEQVFLGQVERVLLLAGRSLSLTLRLAARVKAARTELFHERIRVYGAETRVTGVGAVPETDVLLPDRFKWELLGYLDGFWKGAVVCARMRIASTRGVLFVGAPGTGKTLTVRHVLGRYPACERFVFVTESPAAARNAESAFRIMLRDIAEAGAPAMVVLEDVDRLLDSGVVTAEFFLNVLDGLFQPSQPVLWVATSNDPSRLEQNLLDRPGRFDRVFVFPLPGENERIRLLQRYSPWPVDDSLIMEIAHHSQGLTGAHVREMCYAAAVTAAEAPARYGEALRDELARVLRQHEQARSYDFELGVRRTGFTR